MFTVTVILFNKHNIYIDQDILPFMSFCACLSLPNSNFSDADDLVFDRTSEMWFIEFLSGLYCIIFTLLPAILTSDPKKRVNNI